MPAGGEEQAIGKPSSHSEAGGERVRFEVIDRHQGLVIDEGDRFGGGQPHDHAADQAGTGRRCHTVELVVALAGLCHGLADDEIERLNVGARGNFRHHAAEGRVLIDL
jgi:hypothetical protein